MGAEPARFTQTLPPRGQLLAEPGPLASVAADVLRWLAANPDDPAASGSVLAGAGSHAEAQATLRWLVEVERADRGASAQRLLSPDFLAEHLRFRQWVPDRAGAEARGIALGEGEIRLTKYLAWRVTGRRTREPGFDCALYEVPTDELHVNVAGRTDLMRYRFTRREVLDGAFEAGGPAAGGARALAWLPRSAVHEALMQGTVVVVFPTGPELTLNVHRNNGVAWRPEVARQPELQGRLWYFREVVGLQGYGGDDKVLLHPRVVVAGDVLSLGLGSLFALVWAAQGQEYMRLVVLADTGGAFHPNLFQLDWLVGTFANRTAFETAASAMPDRVRAFAVSARGGV